MHLICEKGVLQGWGPTKDKGRAHKRFGAHSSKQGLTLQARGKGKGKQGKEAHQGEVHQNSTHGMEMELEASLRAHLGMRSTRLEGERFSSL